jgi:hypothetical protein
MIEHVVIFAAMLGMTALAVMFAETYAADGLRLLVALAMWLGVGILTAAAALLVLLVGEAVRVRP